MIRAPYVPTASDIERRSRVFLTAPGFYAIKLARGAVEVAAKVEHGPTPDPDFPGNPMDRSPWWRLTVDGQEREPQRHGFDDVTGRQISEGEYRYMLAARAWARQYAPGSAEAQTTRRVPLDELPLPF